MPRVRVPDCRYFWIVLLIVLASLGISLRAQNQTDQPPADSQNQSPFQVKVASNLVVVRVVVRDSQGKPVKGLHKEDFRLFDRGKEQSIAQFEAEVSAPQAPAPATATPSSSPIAQAKVPVAPQRFLVLYFDDLDMSDTDVIDARDAADHYLATNLQPSERVAVFTSSAMLSDFTVDLKQIHDALFRLHPHPHASSHADCPAISDYQASEISEQDNPNMSDAWKTALDEAVNRCHMPKITDVAPPGSKAADPPAPSDAAPETVAIVRNLARSILAQSQTQARTGLRALEQVVNIVSREPGQRSIILVSPGFLSQSEQDQLDRIIDRALRSEVVISSLDPRGLALLMREADVTNGYAPASNSGAVGGQHTVDTNREMVATDVLAEVAEGTGGEFFHNNNDLTAGFRALAGSQGSYVLAFAPSDVKRDGKFHALKVTLAEKHRGLTLQARRGYFALKERAVAEAPPQLETRPEVNPATNAEAQEKERIRQAVISKTDAQDLPVEVRSEVSKAADNDELAVLIHLDAKALHFHKEGARNQNTVTLVSVVFDATGKYLTGQQRQARVDLPDDTLPKLLASGMDIKIIFQLKPGTYTIREVVTDSEDHRLSALSRSVEVP
jgi:VWFA-related protein